MGYRQSWGTSQVSWQSVGSIENIKADFKEKKRVCPEAATPLGTLSIWWWRSTGTVPVPKEDGARSQGQHCSQLCARRYSTPNTYVFPEWLPL